MTLYVNNSLLTLLAGCETKTWIRWGRELVSKEVTAPGPMEVGLVVHRAMEAWLGGAGKWDTMVALEEAWQEVIGENLPVQERLHPGNVKACLAHWMGQESRRDVQVVQTEKAFEVPLGTVAGEEVVYYGTPDAIIEWKGEWYVLDHKSTGDIDDGWAEQWSMNTGLQGYVWGLRALGQPIKGAFVNGIELKKLPPWDGNMDKKCGTHKVKYQECQALHVRGMWVGPLWWSEARLAQWRDDALSMVTTLQWIKIHAQDGLALSSVRMDGQFKWPGCNGGRGRAACQYRGWCQAGRPLQGLEMMMVRRAWRKEEQDEDR